MVGLIQKAEWRLMAGLKLMVGPIREVRSIRKV